MLYEEENNIQFKRHSRILIKFKNYTFDKFKILYNTQYLNR